ncbi:MAG: lipopolysaccharide biosynthesis protein [Actinomycetota bacterium]|nr:lipopolysaccharide biosynthesis protein [Actinomycetota bacterium]MDQ3640208.1 lipopolysaccharide biosynthesis protein [Actinomycetota bacterium]
MDALERKAIRGAPWSLLSYGATRSILLLNTIVLARLLQPSDFGVLALATLAVGAFGFIGELGLGSAFTIRQDLDRRAQGTVLSLMLIGGGLSAGVVAGVSALAVGVFGEPRLGPVLAALSVTLLINGFTWFYEQVLTRELEFRRRFVALMAQAVTNLVTAVSLAVLGAGIWSLVVGQLAGMAAQGVTQLRLSPYRVRLTWDWKVAREMIAAGRGFMALGGLTFVRQNLDYIAVARVLGSRSLGYYSMAYRLSELPAAGIAGPIAAVTFPAFARMRSREEDVTKPFLKTLRFVAFVTAPVGLGLSAASEAFVLTVFGNRWTPMIGALTVLGLWAVLRPLQLTYSWFLNAAGQPGTSAVLMAVSLGLLGPGTFFFAALGIEAVAWVMLGEAVITLALHMWVVGYSGVPVKAQASALWPIAVAIPMGWLGTWGVARLTADLLPLVSLLLSLAALAVTYTMVVAVVNPSTIREGLQLAARTMGRGGSELVGANDLD